MTRTPVVLDELDVVLVVVVLEVVEVVVVLWTCELVLEDPDPPATWTTGVPDPWPPTESGGVMVPPGLMTVVTVP
ncbi:MAG TPA: hypothetical protein VNV17_19530, partial [Solirubrobacteraceae bacterium]|nr:hypothetical protein [Solirubrobacteraceae bacterium]